MQKPLRSVRLARMIAAGATILVGDIGGTKTAIAVFESRDSGLQLVAESTFASGEHDSLDAILQLFGDDHPGLSIDAACIGVAGVVIDGQSKVTNLPWVVSQERLADVLDVRCAVLLNDLEACAYGVLVLSPEDRATLNSGVEDGNGNIAVIAAGTGLGEALLIWEGSRYHAVASEGGHAGFAPADEEQVELLRFLRARLGNHISNERLLSGPGLQNLYHFVRQRSHEEQPSRIAERMSNEDPSVVIAQLALASEDGCCVDALRLFVSIYAAAAGDLALTGLTTGGVYLCGGIAPQILPALSRSDFMRAFADKGRFSALMERIPVHVALDPKLPLLGAAHYGLARFQASS